MAAGDKPLLFLSEVSVIFWRRTGPVRALAEVTLAVKAGEFVLLTGRSGSGKSLLLEVAAGERPPSAGSVFFDGMDIYAERQAFRNHIRPTRLGFLSENPLFPPRRKVLETVLQGVPSRLQVVAQERAERFLDQLGLAPKADWFPPELSSGELHRLAFIRALAPKPDLVVLDNPTAHLDDHYGNKVADILHDFHLRGGTVLLASNDPRFRKLATRTLSIEDGIIR